MKNEKKLYILLVLNFRSSSAEWNTARDHPNDPNHLLSKIQKLETKTRKDHKQLYH